MNAGQLRCLGALLTVLAAAAPAPGQGPAQIEAIAVAGKPLGVGQLRFTASPNVRLDSSQGDPVLVREKDGRLHYPAFSRQPVRGLLRNLLNRPQRLTIWFLFRGNEPLEISIPDLGIGPVVVRPIEDPAGRATLLTAWWQQYTSPGPLGGLFSTDDATPPDVKDYLTAMLASRLKLQPPWDGEQPALDDPMGLLLGSENLRRRLLQRAFLHAGPPPPADQPLPEPIALPLAPVGQVPEGVKVEPLAAHVPQECLYVRFGGFGNFQWFRTFTSDLGGDIRQLVSARGLDYELNTRLERQLLLKNTLLGKLFGDLLISDVAFVASDTFLREGAAMGLMFEARNGLLGSNFQQQRQAALREIPEAKHQQLEIAGREVSLISTPNGSVRSYYAVDGNYHFFATSRALVERFFEAGAGTGSLAASHEFQQARAQFPLDRRDAVFAFISTAFMQRLVSPQYRIEMDRRLASSVELELLELARLAARSEGMPADSVEQLIAGGFLPLGFGNRCDGSRPEIAGEPGGPMQDSLRGVRGAFVPIPDVALAGATQREVEDYLALAQYLNEQIEHVEPWVVAIGRTPLPEQQERITIDLRVSPSGGRLYEMLRDRLGNHRPTDRQVRPIAGNVAAFEGLIGGRHVFGGLRDCNPLRIFGMDGENLVSRLLLSLTSWPTENLVGYVGVEGNGEALGFLGDFRFGPPDPAGFSQSDGPIWRRQWDTFTVLSFHPQVLEQVVPQLEMVEAERPAHARIRVADLRGTQLAEGIDSFVARRAKAVSLGNVRLLDSLIQQLHVPAAESRSAAEKILGARLVCPVDGKFALSASDRPEMTRWVWQPPTEPGRPANGAGTVYLADMLNWFRGLQADAVLERKTVTAHLELLSQPTPPAVPAGRNAEPGSQK